MTEKILMLLFCSLMIFLFSLNFNKSWCDKNYQKLKSYQKPWFWFRILNIEETEDNYSKFQKSLSSCVIIIMIISILVICIGK